MAPLLASTLPTTTCTPSSSPASPANCSPLQSPAYSYPALPPALAMMNSASQSKSARFPPDFCVAYSSPPHRPRSPIPTPSATPRHSSVSLRILLSHTSTPLSAISRSLSPSYSSLSSSSSLLGASPHTVFASFPHLLAALSSVERL
ncbi:hypothetical protein PENSPDRAFT_218485 [Peniophora sp. CONT]|nr:hypothetical protein PENSPDRAFT_218485 [Peniophora sp. CONT]